MDYIQRIQKYTGLSFIVTYGYLFFRSINDKALFGNFVIDNELVHSNSSLKSYYYNDHTFLMKVSFEEKC